MKVNNTTAIVLCVVALVAVAVVFFMYNKGPGDTRNAPKLDSYDTNPGSTRDSGTGQPGQPGQPGAPAPVGNL
ncbi:MAG: hypothetical protein HUU60_04695 [Armatimonadetes bacterium]|nr:hypothetical protein [Armatimonadota bacterium]